jgi:hypothetical protein
MTTRYFDYETNTFQFGTVVWSGTTSRDIGLQPSEVRAVWSRDTEEKVDGHQLANQTRAARKVALRRAA